MFENQLFKNYNAAVWDITMHTSLAIVDLTFKIVTPGLLLGYQEGLKFYGIYKRNTLKYIFKNYNVTVCDIAMQRSPYIEDSKL